MLLKVTARKAEDSVKETLTYCDFYHERRARIRTNKVIERLNREIRRRAHVIETLPGGSSALIPVCTFALNPWQYLYFGPNTI